MRVLNSYFQDAFLSCEKGADISFKHCYTAHKHFISKQILFVAYSHSLSMASLPFLEMFDAETQRKRRRGFLKETGVLPTV